MAILLALIPIIQSLIGGASFASILGGLGLSDWIGLAGTLVEAEPDVLAALSALHPVFAQLIADTQHHGPQAAGKLAWKRRQPRTIPGYLPDGSAGEVPNPDYLAS
jgi:hypothetical protein